MEQKFVCECGNIKQLFEREQKAIGELAKEVAEREFEVFELNLFVSASGDKHINRAIKSVQRIRKLENEGKISLEEFEELSNKF